MKNNRYTIAATALCVLFWRISRHARSAIGSSGSYQVGIAKASDVEAGSNIAPGAPTTGKSMNDAFNVHTLVAGEWS